MSDLIKLGALWRPRNENSKAVLTGSVNQDMRIVIMPNGFKKKDNDPDFIIYLSKAEKKDQEKPRAQADEDIPF
jgi:uncharacterized protein (DUF736 family)